MKVRIPSPLHSYTQSSEVSATGATLAELLADLDRQYPGLRFRVVDELERLRPHIRIFVNQQQSRDLGLPLAPGDTVQIIQALSGG